MADDPDKINRASKKAREQFDASRDAKPEEPLEELQRRLDSAKNQRETPEAELHLTPDDPVWTQVKQSSAETWEGHIRGLEQKLQEQQANQPETVTEQFTQSKEQDPSKDEDPERGE